MLPYPLENNLFLPSSETSTAWCCSETPIAFQSAPEAYWPQALPYTPISAWPFHILGSRSSELSSRILPACHGQRRDPPPYSQIAATSDALSPVSAIRSAVSPIARRSALVVCTVLSWENVWGAVLGCAPHWLLPFFFQRHPDELPDQRSHFGVLP
jgi:hypothetical protein